MCQAAAERVVDFQRFDPRDRRSWMHLRIMLDLVEESNCNEIRRLNHAAAVALLPRTDLTEESLEKVREHADSLTLKVKKSRFPWVDFDDTSGLKAAIKVMSDHWAREWGDPDSPETQARIEATARAMAAQLAPPPPAPQFRKPAAKPARIVRPRRRPGR